MISYSILSDAVYHYKQLGFEYIEVPWYAPESTISITRPENLYIENDFRINNKDQFLVASAEQSFLDMIINDKIKPGKYVAVTPCFRNDEVDILHQKYFMKCELIEYLDSFNMEDSIKRLSSITMCALSFFISHLPNVYIETTNDKTSILSRDILSDNIELGSYGIRSYNGKYWIYGTGCAEPRLSKAIEISVNKILKYNC